jgi:diadenosine tetraphosphatase ApaH/serine/threonine PP2A family protein phosphatase
MRVVLIADIHGNLPALEAVLADASRVGFDRLVCLGDIVGYNAEPGACVDRIEEATDVAVAGNHDRDVASGLPLPGTTSTAQAVQDWTRRQLSPKQLTYLSALPNHVVDEAGFVAAHGSFLSDVFVSGYVTSTMLEENLQAIAAREGWPRVAFCAHTHVPLFGWLDGENEVEVPRPETCSWFAKARAVLVNPGSVGQPRDGDIRASYALVDLEKRQAEFRRVSYDIERTIEAIRRANLPSVLADRLREGR